MYFWNNPIVVSAMRLKYRRSSPGLMAAVWAMGLLALGIALHYIALSQPPGRAFPVAKMYLLILFGAQFVLCAAVGLITTTSSMNAEVNNRTLDFQRIVSLSPQAILVGKMIGEPAVAYFLAMASVPFAVLCWAAGGGRASEILFFYVNLATFTVMAASLGLIHSLNPPSPGAARQRQGGGAAAFVVLFVVLPQLLVRTGYALNLPVLSELLHLLTPIGSLHEFWQGNAWRAHLTLWGVSVPSLLVAPAAQLGVAAWIVAAMARRLKNPVDAALTKVGAYGTVFGVDLLLAAVCYAQWRNGASPGALVHAFCLAHLVLCLLAAFAMAPRQTAVLSWLWRRGRRSATLRERALSDRAEISVAAVVLGLIGPAVLGIGFFAPMYLRGWPADAAPPDRLLEVCGVTVVLVTAVLVLYQLLCAVPKGGGPMIFLLLLAALNVLPPITAAVLEASDVRVPRETLETIASLSPAAYYILNMASWSPSIHGGWLTLIYACLGAAAYRLLRRWLRRQTVEVDRKLQSMDLYPSSA